MPGSIMPSFECCPADFARDDGWWFHLFFSIPRVRRLDAITTSVATNRDGIELPTGIAYLPATYQKPILVSLDAKIAFARSHDGTL